MELKKQKSSYLTRNISNRSLTRPDFILRNKLWFLLQEKFRRNTCFYTIFEFFRLILGTFLLIIFEIAFFFLFSRIGSEFLEIWILQAFCLISYGFFVYGALIPKRSLFLKVIQLMLKLLMLTLSVILFLMVSLYFNSLIILKLIFGGLTAYYTVNTILLIKVNRKRIPKRKLKSILIIGIIYFASTGFTTFLMFTTRTIEIRPKTEPEIIFWCGSSQLPDDPEVLDMCKKYNIAFMPTIRRSSIGNEEYMQKYRNITSYGINLYFCIGGDSGFFANINNAKEFPSIYRDIRTWFLNESLFRSENIKAFCIDAEPPKDYIENMDKGKIIESIDYGIENYPTKKEIKEAIKSLNEFTEMIEDDEKESGIVKPAQIFDDVDNDADLSLFRRNVFNLNIKFDFSVSMLYRTNRLQYDESDDEPPAFIGKSLSLGFGAVIEGSKFTTSELSFYQNVAMEENSKQANLIKEHYIFIGNFKREFRDTKYIKDKQYFKDFDICRHFKNDKVFFYDLKGFVSHYGWEGVKELGEHARKKKMSYLEYTTYKSLTFLMFYCGLIIVDIIAFLERDLI